MTRLGFIGLGSQGAPMARRMSEAGFPVSLWARRPEALVQFADTTCEIVSSIAELGKQAEHVGICVVDDAGVQVICDELIPAMRPGCRIVVHSTVHPKTMVALGTQAASRGIFVLDAPVSGGGGAAAARKLTVMVGGDVDTFEAARPILETFAGLLVHVGDLGAAQMAKLINNALMAAHVSIAHHALGVGSTLGLNRQALSEIVKVSSGRSFGFEVYSRLPTPGAFEHGARLLAKDVRLLGEALESTEDASFATLRDLVTPFLNLVHEDAGQRTR